MKVIVGLSEEYLCDEGFERGDSRVEDDLWYIVSLSLLVFANESAVSSREGVCM